MSDYVEVAAVVAVPELPDLRQALSVVDGDALEDRLHNWAAVVRDEVRRRPAVCADWARLYVGWRDLVELDEAGPGELTGAAMRAYERRQADGWLIEAAVRRLQSAEATLLRDAYVRGLSVNRMRLNQGGVRGRKLRAQLVAAKQNLEMLLR